MISRTGADVPFYCEGANPGQELGQMMREVGGYKIIEKVGEGGMATVYRGVQVSLNRPVAIKVLSRQLSGDRDAFERFKRESVIVARLAHPNIVHVIDRGVTSAGMPYFVMEYLEGSDLAEVIREGRVDSNRKLDLMIQMCKALSYAHKNGVIHRDIKPANVWIDRDGNARVLDFGIAQFSDGGPTVERTQAGVIMGTLAYMAPEQQVSADRVTTASDLYSLGAVMYELFTEVKPLGRFQRPSEIDPAISSALEELILRCLEPDPANRFASADEVKDRLLQLLQGAHLQTDQRAWDGNGEGNPEEKFALLDVIKEDRFGAVYLYEDRVDHKLIVIKRRACTTPGYTEAKLLTTLKHRNIVNVLGASKNDRQFIVVMEYLTGGSLTDRLILPIPWGDVLRTGREICEGFSFAHRNRIVHGNLRPSNILFAESGQAKITDFGLGAHYDGVAGIENWYSLPGEPKSQQSDIFAAGVILHQMLTGTLPVWEMGRLVPRGHFEAIPADFQRMVSKMCSHERVSRYSSFDQILAQIDALVATRIAAKSVAPVQEESDLPTVLEITVGTGKGGNEPLSEPGPRSGPRLVSRLGLALSLVVVAIVALFYSGYAEPLEQYSRKLVGGWDKAVGFLASLLPK